MSRDVTDLWASFDGFPGARVRLVGCPWLKPGAEELPSAYIVIQENFLFKSLPSSWLSTLNVLIETEIGSLSEMQLSLSCAISFA